MENLNIIQLIERNPISRLSKDYENKLINKIKSNFTDTQQQIFVSSFYCFLNYDSKKDFVIDFDKVWKWVGYTRKSEGKRVLEKNFTIDIDYKVEKLPTVSCGASLETEFQVDILHGGHNKEKITITVNTFKKFCIKANTKKADEIHDYYIKLEEILQETVNEETNELREQLDQSNKKIKGNEQRIKQLENRILVKQSRIRYKERNVIYIVQDEFHKKDRIYVIGKAIDLCERLSTYNKTREHEVIYYKECNSAQQMALIEKCVLYKLDKYREVRNRDRFILPEDKDIYLFTNVINFFIDAFEDIHIDVDIDVDIEKDLTEQDSEDNEFIEQDNEDIEVKKKYIEEAKIKMQEYKKEYYIKNLQTITETHNEYREDHKEEKRLIDAIYNQNNKDKISEKKKIYRENNRDVILQKKKIYYENNKEVITEKHKIYCENNKEKISKRKKEYHEENKDIINKNRKIYREENKDLIKEQNKIYHQKKSEKITCECGITLKILNSKSKKHINSKAHQNFINSKKTEIEVVKLK